MYLGRVDWNYEATPILGKRPSKSWIVHSTSVMGVPVESAVMKQITQKLQRINLLYHRAYLQDCLVP